MRKKLEKLCGKQLTEFTIYPYYQQNYDAEKLSLVKEAQKQSTKEILERDEVYKANQKELESQMHIPDKNKPCNVDKTSVKNNMQVLIDLNSSYVIR